MRKIKIVQMIALLALAVTACTATPDAMADPMMEKETPAAEAMMDVPAWFTTELTEVTTGETFSIVIYKGKVVLVEMMAQWCPTCLSQAKQVKELHSMLGESAEFVSVSLDIDPNEDAATLKTYVERNGFSWMFAVAPAEVSREIGNLYGSQYLNPPSAPILLVDRDGNTHLLDYGLKSAQELKDAIEPLLNGGM